MRGFDCCDPLCSNILCYFAQSSVAEIRFHTLAQRLEFSASSAYRFRTMVLQSHDFLQCFLPASPGSLVHYWQTHYQLPALFLRGNQFSPASTGSSLDLLLLLDGSLWCLSALQGRKEGRGLGPCLSYAKFSLYMFLFSIDWKKLVF